MGAFEISVSVLREAASLASTVPYVGAIAGIFLQIIRIKSVTFFFHAYPAEALWLSWFFLDMSH